MVQKEAGVEGQKHKQGRAHESKGLVHRQKEDAESHDDGLAEDEPALVHQVLGDGIRLGPTLAEVHEGEPGIEDVEDEDRRRHRHIPGVVPIHVEVVALPCATTRRTRTSERIGAQNLGAGLAPINSRPPVHVGPAAVGA